MSDSGKHHKGCVKLNQSATIEQSANTPAELPVFTGPRMIRTAVNLGEFDVTTNLAATITFPDPVLEIKDVKKRVEIVQCRLMTEASAVVGGNSTGPFPLFIKGYVRKNIQYASPQYNSSGKCVSSEMKSLTTRIPFEMTTLVTLTAPALLPVLNERSEYDFAITKDLGPGFPEKDKFHSSDLSEFHQQSVQNYNDMPYCELVAHIINEWDEATDRELLDNNHIGEGFFHHISEKMMLTFTVRVLQVQNLAVGEE